MKTELELPITFPSAIYENETESFERVLLCLHGYQLDGRFMFKRFEPLVNSKTKVISPNAPFLVPLKKEGGWEPRYSWYFFDSSRKSFYINYDPAAKWLADLMALKNPNKRPVTIIGYSQGGYLAPKAAELVPECDRVIGINSIFRSEKFEHREAIEYLQLNGTEDKIVSCKDAKTEFDSLIKKGARGKFETCKEGHLLNQSMIKKSTVLLGEAL